MCGQRLPAFDSSQVRWRTIVHGTLTCPLFVLSSGMHTDPAYVVSPPLTVLATPLSPGNEHSARAFETATGELTANQYIQVW